MNNFLFNDVIKEFCEKEKIKFYFLFVMSFIAGLFEYMGLILIFQFVLFLSNPTTKYCESIINFFKINFGIEDYSKISLILGITIGAIYISKNIYMLIFSWFNNKILQDLSVKITLKTIKNILYQDYLKVIKTSKEEKINILSKINLVVWEYCYKYINLITNSIIVLILLLYLYLKFTIPAVIATVFISALSLIEYKVLKKDSTKQNKCYTLFFNDLNTSLIKAISSLKEIKLNNKQECFIEKIEKKAKDYASLNKVRNFYDVFHIYFTEISVIFTFTIVLIALFYTTNFNNQLLITSISTICVIILRITPLINRIQSCLYCLNSNQNLVLELLKFNKDFDKNTIFKNTKEKLPFNSSIKLKNIYFKYNENNSGLNNINLEIKKGDFIGIVGQSGCYKTTLSLIISGLIKQKKGSVEIDNQILDNDNIQKWQNNIGILSQDYSLLSDIKDFSKEQLEQLNISNSDKITELSHGEKQRLALLNVLSQNKEVLILDEITSSSDVLSENKINDILKELKGKKTIISIAHRLQILKYCDKIIYMDKGQIIDIDTFKNLSEKYKDFKKIIELSNFHLS